MGQRPRRHRLVGLGAIAGTPRTGVNPNFLLDGASGQARLKTGFLREPAGRKPGARLHRSPTSSRYRPTGRAVPGYYNLPDLIAFKNSACSTLR